MNVCQLKPGFTDMTSTMSTSSTISSMADTGVAGLSATPTVFFSARIACSVRCRCRVASTCTVSPAAPALANVSRYRSGASTIRCTSRGSVVALLKRLHDGRAERQVRHELAVHHVEVQGIGAAGFDGPDGRAHRQRVGGDDRRRDVNRVHRLTSREMASPGATWKPARGLCRSTMFGAMPGYG